ncbi:molybdenum hydroxylase accessory protein, YgfJ family [Shewanella baltica]|jgi:molybdenum cofactor cytidylyltransferase|uniref:nucleotidyltransferase family protein n=1 Tax=Shewanella baltica TaxID=62322 RepID=UPI000F7077FF|nr:nucleotidyltransferase family protein [Shewanella baltica]MCS6153526.1 nucleotidyltransferase family protein [Shewanella baltica]VEF25567.1 molybdenum hydroxylase accessory protein, YgfJ family [Shewanella baltica]
MTLSPAQKSAALTSTEQTSTEQTSTEQTLAEQAPCSSKRLLIVVLAAGESKRFEGVKLAQLIPSLSATGISEQAIISTHVERLQQLYCQDLDLERQETPSLQHSSLLIILGAHQPILQPLLAELHSRQPFDILVNPQWQTGLASSVSLAASYVKEQGFDAMLLTLADQVALSVEDYRQLILMWHKTGKEVAAHYLDDLGVPAIFNASTLPLFTHLSGDRGAKSILKQQAQQGALVAITLPSAAIDIDTQADLASWLALKE